MMLFNRRLAAAAVAALLLAACSVERPAFKGIDITGAQYARQLDLPDSGGRARNLTDFKGKVVVVFFGFTQCPEVCPTTLAEIGEIKRTLGSEGDKVQALFVTLDPERDTPEVLSAYMANFGRDFIALRGSLAQTAAAAKEFKIFFAKVPGESADSYSIDHTAGSFVIDAQGRTRLFFRYGSGVEAMAHDIKLLLAGA